MQQPKIVIVGGSLVGPAGDLFLRAQGFTDITVLEASKHPVSQSGGVMGVRDETLMDLAGIGIPTHAIKALSNPDVYAYDLVDGDFRKRGVSTFPGTVTSWDALHYELGRRVDVHLGHTVTSMHHAGGRTYLNCTCSDVPHVADLVLWADGRKSTGRTLLDPHRPLAYNGYVIWRGLVNMPANTDVHGFDRFYDIDGGRLFSLTEPVLQSGRNYFEFSHNLDAKVWTQLTGKRPEQHAYMLPQQVHADVLNVIREHAQGLPHNFEEIIEHAEISGIPVNDVHFPQHLIHGPRDGAVHVLFGDAAIPVRLQVGAGLNQGIQQMKSFVDAYTAQSVGVNPWAWERDALADLARWVEQGRSRAHRINLGWYEPVKRGATTAPLGDQWEAPAWVTA